MRCVLTTALDASAKAPPTQSLGLRGCFAMCLLVMVIRQYNHCEDSDYGKRNIGQSEVCSFDGFQPGMFVSYAYGAHSTIKLHQLSENENLEF